MKATKQQLTAITLATLLSACGGSEAPSVVFLNSDGTISTQPTGSTPSTQPTGSTQATGSTAPAGTPVASASDITATTLHCASAINGSIDWNTSSTYFLQPDGSLVDRSGRFNRWETWTGNGSAGLNLVAPDRAEVLGMSCSTVDDGSLYCNQSASAATSPLHCSSVQLSGITSATASTGGGSTAERLMALHCATGNNWSQSRLVEFTIDGLTIDPAGELVRFDIYNGSRTVLNVYSSYEGGSPAAAMVETAEGFYSSDSMSCSVVKL